MKPWAVELGAIDPLTRDPRVQGSFGPAAAEREER
jgi:hypothetical protein